MAEKKSTAQAQTPKRQNHQSIRYQTSRLKDRLDTNTIARNEDGTATLTEPTLTPSAPSVRMAARNPIWPMVLGGGLAAGLGFGARPPETPFMLALRYPRTLMRIWPPFLWHKTILPQKWLRAESLTPVTRPWCKSAWLKYPPV